MSVYTDGFRTLEATAGAVEAGEAIKTDFMLGLDCMGAMSEVGAFAAKVGDNLSPEAILALVREMNDHLTALTRDIGTARAHLNPSNTPLWQAYSTWGNSWIAWRANNIDGAANIARLNVEPTRPLELRRALERWQAELIQWRSKWRTAGVNLSMPDPTPFGERGGLLGDTGIPWKTVIIGGVVIVALGVGAYFIRSFK